MCVTIDTHNKGGITPPRFQIDAEHCSVCGKDTPNEDYALFERNVGMCVADGIGGAPLGDAAARYACHIAMGVLRDGGTSYEAVRRAGEEVGRFVSTVDSPGSGASLVVARLNGDMLEASWAGDAAIFMLGNDQDGSSLITNLTFEQPESEVPLCGRLQPHPGKLSKQLKNDETVVLCTDGAWRSIKRETIAKLMRDDVPLREMAARLVLGQHTDDDATVLVARVHESSRPLTKSRRE